MKKTLCTSILTFIFLFLALTVTFAQTRAIAAASSVSTNQPGSEYKDMIVKLNKEIAEAMITGNHEKSISFYTKDVISLPNYSKMLEGIDAIRKSNEVMEKAGWKVKSFEPKTLNVTSCDNLITEIGIFKISFFMEGMEKPIDESGKYITIWEKQEDGSLKIKLEMWNSDTSPIDKKM